MTMLLALLSALLTTLLILQQGGLLHRWWHQLRKQRDQQRRIPCPRCRYFHNNLHLRCGVHPKQVMTAAACDCRDFEPRHRTLALDSFDTP